MNIKHLVARPIKAVVLLGCLSTLVFLNWLLWNPAIAIQSKIDITYAVFGTLTGGVTGILTAPNQTTLDSRISLPVKLAILFIFGYIFAKIDPLISAFFQPEFWIDSTRVLGVGIFCTSYIVTAIFGYIFSEHAIPAKPVHPSNINQLSTEELDELEDIECYGDFFTASDHSPNPSNEFDWLPD